MRVASIDIGTNTVLLLVAEPAANGELRAVEEAATITRLGQGVDESRALAPEAIERTRACLERYAEIVRRHRVDRVAVVGTSAMRDASGGEKLRQVVQDLFGVEARTLSGQEEARLTFEGATSGLGVSPGDETCVFDIGGGSTEVVLGTVGGGPSQESDTLKFAQSFDVGSVRLTERHVSHDPMTDEEIATVRRLAEAALSPIGKLRPATAPIGIAGTVTTLAAISLRLVPYDGAKVHGHRMTRAELERVVMDLAKKPLASRKGVPGLEPKRADVIVAGGLIVLAVLTLLDQDQIVVSDRGVRWGVVEELIRKQPRS
jgi:exopolyphosphatase/guanosine-5'-triphosphate,3'-diphosphate pyrophosphatase